jgi:predicted XRE-type DNA-binding protein
MMTHLAPDLLILTDMVNRERIRIELANSILNMASHMTSSLLAVRIRLDAPKVAALRNGRLEIFSIERLMDLATRLGHDVEITIRPHPRQGHRRSRLGVVRVVDLSDSNEVSIT